MNEQKQNNKTLLGVCLVLAIAGVIAGLYYAGALFHPKAAASAKTEVVVRIGTFSTAIDYAPFVIAKAKGWIDEALKPVNARATYETFQTLPSINESLSGGKIDCIFEAEPPAIVAKSADIDVRIIAMSCTINVQAIVPPNSPVKSVSDLRGKRVAVLFGSGAHYGLMKNAKAAGLKDNDIQPLDMVPPDARAAFDSGQLDAWMVWSPWPEQEVVKTNAVFLPGTETPIHSLLVARNELLQQHPEIMQALVGAVDKAKLWIKGNPEEAKKVMSTELGLPLDVVELAWPRMDWSARFSDSVVDDIQAKGEFLVQLKFIKRVVDVRKELMAPIGDSK